jgi:TonB family protein
MRFVALLLVSIAAAPSAAQDTVALVPARACGLYEVDVCPEISNVAEVYAAMQRLYPPYLRDAGVGDTVFLAFTIGEDGRPQDVRVASAWNSAFGPPSVEAMSLAAFSPAQRHGQPVAVRVHQPMVWRTPLAGGADADTAPEPVLGEVREIYGLGEVEILPRPTNLADLRRALEQNFPPALRATGTCGSAMAKFLLDTTGKVQNVTVIEASDSAFIEPTRRAVSVARFRPAEIVQRPVSVWIELPISWMLPVGDCQNRPPSLKSRNQP